MENYICSWNKLIKDAVFQLTQKSNKIRVRFSRKNYSFSNFVAWYLSVNYHMVQAQQNKKFLLVQEMFRCSSSDVRFSKNHCHFFLTNLKFISDINVSFYFITEVKNSEFRTKRQYSQMLKFLNLAFCWQTIFSMSVVFVLMENRIDNLTIRKVTWFV